MKIGIDIDDTIGNFSETLLNYAFEYDEPYPSGVGAVHGTGR